jgi:hypothetical protein
MLYTCMLQWLNSVHIDIASYIYAVIRWTALSNDVSFRTLEANDVLDTTMQLKKHRQWDKHTNKLQSS